MHADIPVLFYIPMMGWPRIILPIVRCISSGCSSSICQSVTDFTQVLGSNVPGDYHVRQRSSGNLRRPDTIRLGGALEESVMGIVGTPHGEKSGVWTSCVVSIWVASDTS